MNLKSTVIIGERFGRLRVLALASTEGHCVVRCLCACGVIKLFRLSSLRHGDVVSCGCWRRQQTHIRSFKHGSAGTSTYMIWKGIRQRCFNKTCEAYKDYGGRGITMCERWKNSFEAFLIDMGHKPDGMTIERIDNDGNYEPGNCKWATRKEQTLNRRATQLITWNKQTKCLADWSRTIGGSRLLVAARLRHGWSVERALTTPVRTRRK